jgi:chromate transporter
MMIYLRLFFSFFKIGLFSFGGGYAMIPMIQKEIEMNGWLAASEFVDIIAIAEMTPGPIAINSATFVGYKTAGFFGGMVATMGVALPSIILVFIVSSFFFKIQKNPVKIMAFYGVRPVVAGLIAAAAVFVAEASIINKTANFVDFKALAILAASLVALVKFKLHPILVIAGAGITGTVIYYLVPLL